MEHRSAARSLMASKLLEGFIHAKSGLAFQSEAALCRTGIPACPYF
jgi:hypothetical protein